MSLTEMKNEAQDIYKEFGIENKSITLLCPIMKVLQMRHSSLNKTQAKRVVTDFLKN